jgi:hypothetical protein
VPLEIIGQHAQEHVRPHPALQPVIDRPDIQIDSFDATERTLDLPYTMPLIS